MIIAEKTCKVEGCTHLGKLNRRNGKRYFNKGFCNTHYQRLYKNSTLVAIQTRGEDRKKDYLYRLIYKIKDRCYNPNTDSYEMYGGRGITLYKEWHGTHGFRAFKEYIETNLGDRPQGYSLDRIDSDGNYEPGNLRWANNYVQAVNKGMLKNNTSGVKGVGYKSGEKLWYAQINYLGKRINLGRFKTKEQAIKARKKAEIKYHHPMLKK